MIFKNRFILLAVVGAVFGTPMAYASCLITDGCVDGSAVGGGDGPIAVDEFIQNNQDLVDSAMANLDALDSVEEATAQLDSMDDLQNQIETATDALVDDLALQVGKKLSENPELFTTTIEGGNLDKATKEKLGKSFDSSKLEIKPIAGTTINGIGYIAFSARVDNLEAGQAKTIRKILGLPSQKDNAEEQSSSSDDSSESFGSLEKVDSVDELKILENNWGS